METKKRFLISKWRGAAMVAYAMGKRVDQLKEELDRLETEQEEYQAQLEDTLESVKYWLHDGLVHGKIVSDPRAMLTKVERVLQ